MTPSRQGRPILTRDERLAALVDLAQIGSAEAVTAIGEEWGLAERDAAEGRSR